jgi:hypothetical protein
MRQAHDTNTPTNIHETTERASITAAIGAANTTTPNTQPNESAGSVDVQRRHEERQKLT